LVTDEVVPGYFGPRTPEQVQLCRELAARIVLFGSPKVRALWEAAMDADSPSADADTSADVVSRDAVLAERVGLGVEFLSEVGQRA
jgi:hypothetical protein